MEMLNELIWNNFKCIQFVCDRVIVDEEPPPASPKNQPLDLGEV